MKLLINLIIFLLFISSFKIKDDNKIYKIDYEYKIELQINENTLKSNSREVIEQIKKSINRVYDYQLITDNYNSVLELIPKVNNSQESIFVEIPPEIIFVYKDLREKTFFDLKELDKKYFVKDSIKHFDWKKTDKHKNISNYKLSNYTFNDDDKFIEIWTCDDIKIPNGPLNAYGFPNLIFEISISNKKGSIVNHNFKIKNIKELDNYNFDKIKPKKTIDKYDFDILTKEYLNKSNEHIEYMLKKDD